MSNYQRLISYIYEYEGEIKGKNIGFAKLETRNGQCRITVNVKKIYVGGNPIGVYLLSSQGEVRIGTIFARNGAAEFRTVVNASNIENSGNGIERFYGLSVHDVESSWQSYTTIWEDAVAHAAEIELANVTAESRKEAGKDEPEEKEEYQVTKEIEEALELEEENKEANSEENFESQKQEEEIVLPGGGDTWNRETAGRRMDRDPLGRIKKILEPIAELASIQEPTPTPRPMQIPLPNPEPIPESIPAPNSEARQKSIRPAPPEPRFSPEPLEMPPMPEPQYRPQPEEMPSEPQVIPPPEEAPQPPETIPQPETIPEPEPQPADPIKPAGQPEPTQEYQPTQKMRPEPIWQSGPIQELAKQNQPEIPYRQPESIQQPEPMPETGNNMESWGMPETCVDWEPYQETENQLAPDAEPDEKEQPELGSQPQMGENPEPSTEYQAKEEPNFNFGQNAAVLDRFDQEEQSEYTHQKVWERLRKMYPKVQAFEYEPGSEILMIKPQDIGLLPRESWVHGNNSFLLHGFYNYRYLILARLENPHGDPRYLLGIPGHYYSNEKYMAAMFGYPNFVLAKNPPPNDVRFGYWYTDIKVGD